MAGYLATLIITAVASLAVAGVLVEKTVRLIIMQVKLYHSINLVELKTKKIMYWVFAAIEGFFIFYLIMQMADAHSPSVEEFNALFGVDRLKTNIALMFVLIVMIAAEAFTVTFAIGRNAVVDKGVYTNFGMIDWHRVRDYIIDEERGILMLSSDKNTFSTLKNVTTPFRVNKKDVQKLKFILNKNKNKFSEFENIDTEG